MREKIEALGMDYEIGLEYCAGEEDFYLEMIEAYLEEENADTIDQKYKDEDWKDYQILVHALKSTSLQIGAVDMSETAKAVELATKEGDINFVKANHEAMLEKYRTLVTGLQTIA